MFSMNIYILWTHAYLINGMTNYYYEFMHFSLNNVGKTYECLMDKKFWQQILMKSEVYANDEVIK